MTPAHSPPTPRFAAELAAITADITAACAAALAAASITPRGTAIGPALKLDKSLAWHIASVATAKHPADVVEHLPSPEGISLVLKAMSRRGVPEALTAALASHTARFEAFQAAIAGDRASLRTMVGAIPEAGKNAQRTMALARRQAFRANAQIFGVQARCQFQLDFVWPDTKTGRLMLATLRGWQDLVRLRPDTRISLGAAMVYNPGQSSPMDPRPLGHERPGSDPTLGPTIGPLVPRFCAGPLPAFQTEADHRGRQSIYVVAGDTGLAGAIDLCMGEAIGPGPAPTASTPGERGEFFARLYMPAEHLVHQLSVHHTLLAGPWRDIPVEFEIVGELSLARMFPFDRASKTALVRRHALPRSGQPEPTSPLRRHAEMIAWCCESLDASTPMSPQDFQTFGVVLNHPPTPATSVISLPLPPESP